jgi:myo-inositol 2-dehydrogenase / D-chiro-inositol 1-dehydrogenase
VNHQLRFMDQYRELRRVIHSEAFGGWTSLTIVGGNMGMAMNGSHFVELFRWIGGGTPSHVSAWFSGVDVPNPRGPQFLDKAGSLRAWCEDTPRKLYFEISSEQGHGLRVIVGGAYGLATLDVLTGSLHLSTRRSAADRSLATTRYAMPSTDEVVVLPATDPTESSRRLLEALTGDHDIPTGEDGRVALATIIAGYVSNENGHHPIRLVEAPRDRVFPFA